MVGDEKLGLERDRRSLDSQHANRRRSVRRSLAEIDADKGGRACLTSRNAVLLDDFDDYIDELAVRVKGAS
ncbi:MAG: hypothetical protein ACXW3G_05545 [Rhodoplanes sp.]